MSRPGRSLELLRPHHDAGLPHRLHGPDGHHRLPPLSARGDDGSRHDPARGQLSISLFVIGAALPVLFWGAAADRYGRRLPLAMSLLLFVGLSLLLATTSEGPLLLILRTLQGVAAGGAAIIARILVRDHWHGDELARRLSVLSIAFITALGGGQWIGGLISRYSHWQLGFVLMAGVGVLALLLMSSLPLLGPNPAAASGGMWARYASLLR
ncbi:MFS transporter, partial [Aeromonas hydrophila]|uniref:MFS transporter n=1 Tax=Aeromonas hydrophila TaxID=644 RepID=UPI000AC0885C